MNAPSDFDLDLDFHFLPAWAKKPPAENPYARFEGESPEGRERPRGERGGWRDEPRERRPFRDDGRRERGPREGDRQARGRPPGPRPEHREPGRAPERRQEPPPIPLPEVNAIVIPEEKGVESLARHVKLTGRAYPLFEIAHFILKKAERFHVKFSVRKRPDGTAAQSLLVCSLDNTLWLDENEIVSHVLTHHFDTFYQAERVPTDPPKGTYTFVAQCGMSGVLLGPPNYHDYQNRLRKLHAERFSRIPFDDYKARVKIVKDETVVKKWIEELSYRTEYLCLNVPETIKLAGRGEVEKHFREVHLQNLVQSVETFTLPSSGHRPAISRGLALLANRATDDQRRFPLGVATALSQQLAAHNLHFFKVNRTVTHVCVARPRFLDTTTTVVSENVRRILDFINTSPTPTRRGLLELFVPTAPASAPAASGEASARPSPATSGSPLAETREPTPEQTAIIADLHWLIHQGHVIEFSNGRLDTAKPPKPKPPPPPPKQAEPSAARAEKPALATEPPAPKPIEEAGPVEIAGAEPAPEIGATEGGMPAAESSASTPDLAAADTPPSAPAEPGMPLQAVEL